MVGGSVQKLFFDAQSFFFIFEGFIETNIETIAQQKFSKNLLTVLNLLLFLLYQEKVFAPISWQERPTSGCIFFGSKESNSSNCDVEK